MQQVKDVNSTKAELNSATNKIQAEYENVVAVRRLRDEVTRDLDNLLMLLTARLPEDVPGLVEGKTPK